MSASSAEVMNSGLRLSGLVQKANSRSVTTTRAAGNDSRLPMWS